jgi:hypothetical protein
VQNYIMKHLVAGYPAWRGDYGTCCQPFVLMVTGVNVEATHSSFTADIVLAARAWPLSSGFPQGSTRLTTLPGWTRWNHCGTSRR